jgi:hypothetical protein
MNIKESDRGWLIEFAPHQAGYFYPCWSSSQLLAVSDRQIGSKTASASPVTQQRIDFAAVKLVFRHCHAMFRHSTLDFDEYRPWQV